MIEKWHLCTTVTHLLGPNHSDTLSTRENLAFWRGRAGDAAGAVATLQEVLSDRLRVLGTDHPATLTLRRDLAYWREQAGLA
ncbi:tetratricopeptide repeat protein [Streptosporangium sp. NPDC002607]